MCETPEELDQLQSLLDSSLSGSTAHLRSIVEGRTITAPQLTGVLTGMCTLALSTVTAKGEPRISGADGHFLHGRWHFGTARNAAKARHLAARPAASVAHLRGEDLGVFIQVPDVRAWDLLRRPEVSSRIRHRAFSRRRTSRWVISRSTTAVFGRAVGSESGTASRFVQAGARTVQRPSATSRPSAHAATGRYSTTTGSGPETVSRVPLPPPGAAVTSWQSRSASGPSPTRHVHLRCSSSTCSTVNRTRTPAYEKTRPHTPGAIRPASVSTRLMCGAQRDQRAGRAYLSHTVSGAAGPARVTVRVAMVSASRPFPLCHGRLLRCGSGPCPRGQHARPDPAIGGRLTRGPRTGGGAPAPTSSDGPGNVSVTGPARLLHPPSRSKPRPRDTRPRTPSPHRQGVTVALVAVLLPLVLLGALLALGWYEELMLGPPRRRVRHLRLVPDAVDEPAQAAPAEAAPARRHAA